MANVSARKTSFDQNEFSYSIGLMPSFIYKDGDELRRQNNVLYNSDVASFRSDSRVLASRD